MKLLTSLDSHYFYFRRKIGPNIGDLKFIKFEKLFEIEKSVLFIPAPQHFDTLVAACPLFERDFDVLVEPLGI